jgi:ABC-type polysaccharide/polyol phosphate export permease
VIGVVRDLWARRELVKYLVLADLKSTHKNTVLGYLWWLLDPLLLMVVYTILVYVLRRDSRRADEIMPYPVFLFTALLAWKSFAYSLRGCVLAITKNGPLIRSVAFPKSVFPVALTLSSVAQFALGVVSLVAIACLFALWEPCRWPSWQMVYFLPAMLLQTAISLGLGLLVAAVGVFFHDLSNILTFVVRLMFYLSPGLYSVEMVEGTTGSHRWLMLLFKANPFAHLFSLYRAGLGFEYPKALNIGTSFLYLSAVALVCLLAGLSAFASKEKRFAKMI